MASLIEIVTEGLTTLVLDCVVGDGNTSYIVETEPALSTIQQLIIGEVQMRCGIVLVILSHHRTPYSTPVPITAHDVSCDATVSCSGNNIHAVAVIIRCRTVRERNIQRLIQRESIKSIVVRLTLVQDKEVSPCLFGALRHIHFVKLVKTSHILIDRPLTYMRIHAIAGLVSRSNLIDVEIVGEMGENSKSSVRSFVDIS